MAEFEVPGSSGPPATPIAPLSRLLVVDPGGGSGTQDGAFTLSKTFSTLAAAVAAAESGSTLLLMPGYDYTSGGAVSWANKILTFWGIGVDPEQTPLPDLSGSGFSSVHIVNCQTIDVSCTVELHVNSGLLIGELACPSIFLHETESTPGFAELTGAVVSDLYSFNLFREAGGILTGTIEIVEGRPVLLRGTPGPANFQATNIPAAQIDQGAEFPVQSLGYVVDDRAFWQNVATSYPGGDVTVAIEWWADAITGNVQWEVALAAMSPGIDGTSVLAKTFATAVAVETAAGGITQAPVVTTIVISGASLDALAQGDVFWLRVQRIAASVDEMAGTANLTQVEAFLP